MNIMRKTRFRKWTMVMVCAFWLMGALPQNAVAADMVAATISPDITIWIDGAERSFFSADGQQVYPLLCQDTVYLPLRSIGELMNKNVSWDQSALTVSISGTRTAAPVEGTRDVDAVKQTIQAQIRPDFTIVVDGAVHAVTDSQGNPVYPLLYSGALYLPIQSAFQLLGRTFSWDLADHTDNLVTDVDHFGQTVTTPQTPPVHNAAGSYIGEERARSAALAHAGLTGKQVSFIKTKLDFDDGRWLYEVEFYTGNGQEYDYDIDAVTGAVLTFDYEVEDWHVPQQTSGGSQIGADKAKRIALDHVGLNGNRVNFVKTKLDYDDNRWEYEIEFVSGMWEYEFEIDAYTGAILSYEREPVFD